MPARTAPWLPLGWNSEILVEDRDFSCNLHFAIIFRMEKLEYIWGFQIVKKDGGYVSRYRHGGHI